MRFVVAGILLALALWLTEESAAQGIGPQPLLMEPAPALASTGTVENIHPVSGRPKAPYSWVVHSAPAAAAAHRVRDAYERRGGRYAVIEGLAHGRPVYRVVTGAYRTWAEAMAARGDLSPAVPSDTWLLRLVDAPAQDRRSASEARHGRAFLHQQPAAVFQERAALRPRPAATTALVPGNWPEHVRSVLPPPALSGERGSVNTDPSALDGLGRLLAQRVRLYMLASSAYESNIDRAIAPEGAVGSVTGLRVHLQSSANDPVLRIEAAVARHAYTQGSDWDRVSRSLDLTIEPDLSGRLRLETEAALSLKGSSEDHDLSDQMEIRQQVEYRATSSDRLQLLATYRRKYYPGDPDRNAFKPNVEVRFDKRMEGARRFELGLRYEINRTGSERDAYGRWTYHAEYRTSLFGSKDIVELEAKYRRRSYRERFVEIEDEDVLRQDFQWLLSTSWSWQLSTRTAFVLDYAFETRDSNDPDKGFDAHQLTGSLVYRWY